MNVSGCDGEWGRLLFRWMDPGCGRQCRELPANAFEVQQMGGEGGIEREGTSSTSGRSSAFVHGDRGHPADATVAMLGVVPVKELLAVCAGVSIEPNCTGKPSRYFRALNCASEYLQMVIRNLWAAVREG